MEVPELAEGVYSKNALDREWCERTYDRLAERFEVFLLLRVFAEPAPDALFFFCAGPAFQVRQRSIIYLF